MVVGYKAFNSDFSNRYGQVFEANQMYFSNDKTIKFTKTGFHLCKNLEDTFRYYDGFSDIKIAKVVGLGKVDKFEDEYYGYYDMYSVERLYILYFLSKEEIFQYLNDIVDKGFWSFERLLRFVSGYKLDEEEKNLIISKVDSDIQKKRLIKTLRFYQDGDVNAFK